ncbi:hypothetical protein FHT80_002799 [Rhizobium sp. BK226]|uniref:hypothetical protein n=1 Tax=Rhizobium sp. BK226 TaxID=2587075 RepID=UPI001611B769|nr:hypothetical protein [Rhizobium sp. BK226]MBB4113473.1 hypothetical protein [Rhizobium sp. BK226]
MSHVPIIAVSGPFVGTGQESEYPLAVDPGSASNMLVNLNGVIQMLGAYGLVRNEIGAFIRINAPVDCDIEVRSLIPAA